VPLILTALSAVGALVFTGLSLQATREGQIADRFNKAVGQLGTKDSLEMRLGGIYALESIALDSDRDHATVMEVLSAYVREHAPSSMCISTAPTAGPTTDVQAILTVIGRRDKNRGRFYELDLTNTCLTKADLPGANLTEANLRGANLTGAYLGDANLTNANFDRANLTDAVFFEAVLVGADLPNADLIRAVLFNADLTSADLRGANLTGANLTNPPLTHANANFTDANLTNVNLTNVNLTGVNFTGANLTNANSPTRTSPARTSPTPAVFDEVRRPHGRWSRIPADPVAEVSDLPAPVILWQVALGQC
jgi:hypothetical protein